MPPRGPYTEIDRTLAAIGFLSEAREAGGQLADCTLTSRSREDLRRRASIGDEDAFAELTRRRGRELAGVQTPA